MRDLYKVKQNIISWQLYKDEEAVTELIKDNMGLVIIIVKRYLGHGLTFEELKSAGMMGLLNAIDKFDYTKSIEGFSTYAGLAIERAIQRELSTYNKHSHVLSLSEPIGYNKDGDELTIEDLVGTDSEELLEEVISNIKNDVVRNALKSLTSKEQKIILLRYGLDESHSMTLGELAEMFNCSKTNIQQYEKKAIKKMRHPRNTRKLKDFIDE